MAQKTPVFTNLDEAKAFAAEQSAKNPRARSVYRLEVPSIDGREPIVTFVVAQSVPRAQNHAFAVLRDQFGISLGVAERTARAKPKSLEEQVRSLSPEEIERVKAMLNELSPEEKASRKRKHAEQE